MRDLIVNFTPTGMVPTTKTTPHVPTTPNQIIETVQEAYEIGITVAHIHAREPDESPSYRMSVYQEIMEGLRKFCPDLVICASLSGRVHSEFEQRSEVLQLCPDMASLTLSSLNFPGQASINTPEMIVSLSRKMSELGVNPELECFDFGMINYSHYLIKKEIITPPFYYNLITGSLFTAQTDLAQVGLMIKELPVNSYWSLGGIGNSQLTANSLAIACGGGVRVGLEDNIWYDRNRKTLATNSDVLKRVHELAEIHERRVMTPSSFGRLGFYNQARLASVGSQEV